MTRDSFCEPWHVRAHGFEATKLADECEWTVVRYRGNECVVAQMNPTLSPRAVEKVLHALSGSQMRDVEWWL